MPFNLAVKNKGRDVYFQSRSYYLPRVNEIETEFIPIQ